MTKFEEFILPILEVYQNIIDLPSAEGVRKYVVNFLIKAGYFELQPPDSYTANIFLTKKARKLLEKLKENKE